LTRLNGLQKLSSTQKQQYSSEVQTDITGLQQLLTQCTTDFNAGNLQALRSDYKSIFTQYRIYAVFLPQLRLLIASDTMGVTADNLSSLATKLQARIQTAGSPSSLTSLLADMQAKISDSQTQYKNVESMVTPLTPNSYNTDPNGTTATFKTARADIKQGGTDLQTAFSDAKQIVQSLKGSTSSPTVMPTITQ